jgi:hypothetical protein
LAAVSRWHILFRLFGSKKELKKELEADTWAAKRGHKQGLIDWLEGFKAFSDRKEIQLRINALKALDC